MSPTRPDKTALKRASGQIACSECSRLKLKCDRQLPACGSCVRRNCAYVCPNGTLPHVPSKKKPVPVDCSNLTTRIQQLEEALGKLQLSISTDRHPLLKDELLEIKFGKKSKAPNGSAAATPRSEPNLLGTLTITPEGDAKYFGPSGAPETLFHIASETLNMSSDSYERCFLFQSPTNVTMEQLMDSLPPKTRAWALCESYLRYGCMREQFIERDELINDILIPVYNRGDPRVETQFQALTGHKIAILFLVFANGAQVDFTIPYDSDEGDSYFQIGRVALMLYSVLNSPELATVQALLLLSFYHLHGGRRYNLDSASTLAGLALKRAESIGLHRESAQWNFDAKTLHRRRYIWWEAFTFDGWLSVQVGRPPTVRLSYVDCPYPVDHEATTDDKGEPQVGVDRWRYMLSEIYTSALEAGLKPETPPYSAILAVDRKIREFPFPSNSHVNLSGLTEDDETAEPHVYMKKYYPTQIRLIAMFHTHVVSFAQSLLDKETNDPLESKWATSFLAAYKAASQLIALYVKHMTRWPELIMRWTQFWGSLLTAAMIVGSIVVRCPNAAMATKSYMELGLAVSMFERGSEQFCKARSGLVVLRKLMARATDVFSRRQSNSSSSLTQTSDSNENDDSSFEDLEIFAGQTKVLVSNLLSHHRRRPALLQQLEQRQYTLPQPPPSHQQPLQVHPQLEPEPEPEPLHQQQPLHPHPEPPIHQQQSLQPHSEPPSHQQPLQPHLEPPPHQQDAPFLHPQPYHHVQTSTTPEFLPGSSHSSGVSSTYSHHSYTAPYPPPPAHELTDEYAAFQQQMPNTMMSTAFSNELMDSLNLLLEPHYQNLTMGTDGQAMQLPPRELPGQLDGNCNVETGLNAEWLSFMYSMGLVDHSQSMNNYNYQHMVT